jgi:hypothetical protein
MTTATDRQAYCRRCARVARILGDSLDPSRPLVVCEWRERDGSRHGHGRAVGTYDQAEAQALLAEAQERRRRANHLAGRHREHPVRACLDCQREAGHARHRALRMYETGCPECEANLAAGRRAYA